MYRVGYYFFSFPAIRLTQANGKHGGPPCMTAMQQHTYNTYVLVNIIK